MKAPAELPLLLLADDSEDDARILRMALERLNAPCRLEIARDGESLLSRAGAAEGRPALILADINLPLKSGLEALQALKSDPKTRAIPLVVWTTSRNPSDVLQSYHLGASSYFAKPDSFDEVVEMLGVIIQYWLKHALLPPH